MADENIILKVGVDASGAETSVKSLKTQMRELKEVMGQHELGSAAFTEAAKKAGELQDKMADIKDAVGAFNPEKKFQAFAGVVGGVANGFQAAQGAMGLFGAENKNLEAALLKTQSAMALANGVNGLLGMKDQFKLLGGVAKDALNGIKGAIGATGIGLLVVALGVIYSNWDSISKAVKDAFPIFNNMGEIFNKLKEYAYGAGEVIKNYIVQPFKAIGKLFTGDFKGALEELKKGFDVLGNFEKGAAAGRAANSEAAAKERLEKLIKQKEKELEVHKAAGKDTFKEELAINNMKQTLAKDNQEELEKLKQEELVLIAAHNKKLSDISKSKSEKDRLDLLAREKLMYEESLKQFGKYVDDLIILNRKKWQEILDTSTKEETSINKIRGLWADDLISTKLTGEQKLDTAKQLLSAGIITKKEYAAAEIEIEKEKEKEKKAVLDTSISLLNSASEAAGKSTEEGKALAAAATAIATYQAAYAAFNSMSGIPVVGFGLGVAAAAAATLSGMTAIKNIYAVKVPNSSGGGGSAPNISAPSMANVSNTTRLTNGNEPILTRTLDVKNNKVFVVESDITNKQKTVKNIQNKATIK